MGVPDPRAGRGRQFALFLASGGVAAAMNWGSRFVFSRWMSFELAVVFAFCVGLATGFVLMRAFVFAGGGRPVVPQAGAIEVRAGRAGAGRHRKVYSRCAK